MSVSTPGKVLASLRLAVGTSAWAAPERAGGMFGLDAKGNPQLIYMGRLFAIRDAVLAAGVLASEGEARKVWWRLGMVCDLSDALAGVIAGRKGQLDGRTTALVTGTALLGLGLGAVALAAENGES